jgi:hypothetical protein
MTPPKIGVLSQTSRKTRSNVRAPYKTDKAKLEIAQRGDFINVDTIPSPHVEPIIPTPMME